jgi:predicted transcriptional regulator of viral defense system
MAPASHRDALLRLAKKRGVFRARDAHAQGVPWSYLGRLVGRGELLRLGRGLYAHPDYEPGEHASLAEVARRAPEAIVCLLSALRFHGLTTQNPFEVWIMIGRKARRPAIASPALRVVRASGKALEWGVETRRIEGVPMRVTSIAKTVCDCFRYRRHVGIEVSIEALRGALAERRTSPRALREAAEADAVTSVIRPYLETLA